MPLGRYAVSIFCSIVCILFDSLCRLHLHWLRCLLVMSVPLLFMACHSFGRSSIRVARLWSSASGAAMGVSRDVRVLVDRLVCGRGSAGVLVFVGYIVVVVWGVLVWGYVGGYGMVMW